MNSYLLLVVIDEGLIHARKCTAKNPRDAIVNKWNLHPYSYPEDWSYVLPDDWEYPEGMPEDEQDEFFQEEVSKRHSFEQAATYVCEEFYNIDHNPKVDPERVGNWVDGDSSAAYILIEFTKEGKINFYPRQHDYLGNPIEV